jgi:hypothetical protein
MTPFTILAHFQHNPREILRFFHLYAFTRLHVIRSNPADKIILFPSKALAYVYIPKVACTSLKIVAARLLGLPSRPTPSEWIHYLPFPTLSPATLDLSRNAPHLFTFGFVRHPIDRLHSCYRNRIRETPNRTDHFYRDGVFRGFLQYPDMYAGMPFHRFAEIVADTPDTHSDEHFRSQHTFFPARQGSLTADFIGRFERLSEDFQALQTMAPQLRSLDLPHRMATRSDPTDVPWQNLPRSLRTRLLLRYERDFEVFEYPPPV